MTRLHLFLLLILLFGISEKSMAQCGNVQVLTTTQQNQLQPLVQALDTALFYEQRSAIDSISALAKISFGSEAGQPDQAEQYVPLSTQTTWLPQVPALQLSRLLIATDSLAYVDVWKLCKGMYPPAYLPHSVPLRAGAEVCAGLLKIAAAETDVARQTAYRQWAVRGLDSLLTMQLNSGAWPFPDLRTYNDPVFTPIINNYLQSLGADSVNVLANGWIIDDSGSGDFKFDAGVIAGAFSEAYQYTGDTAYLGAAKRTAAYLLPLHYNRNYNYNTFATYGLIKAFLYSPTDTTWRERAMTTLREAVLPGQTSNGYWMDGHNAKSVYHAIMMHNMAPVLAIVPATHPLHDTLALMLTHATRAFLHDEEICGASVGYKSLLRLYPLDTLTIPQSLHDSIADVIGRYINQSNGNGNFLDVPTMGLYLELLGIVSGVSETTHDVGGLNVFPNPASDEVVVRWNATQTGTLRIISLQGQILFEQNVNAVSETKCTLTNFSAGVYLVEILAADGSLHHTKIIHE